MRSLFLFLLLTVVALPIAADELLLPVFAYNMPGAEGTAWSSEVYVTNLGSKETTVHMGSFFAAAIDPKPPCQIFVQPFLVVPARSTVLWRSGELRLGIGCADYAVGALTIRTDAPVSITSRMVRHEWIPDANVVNPLSGIGQDIAGVDLRDLPKDGSSWILPAVAWHPNACEPSRFDTNAFFTNPDSTPVRVELDAPPGESQLMVDGEIVDAPHAIEIAPFRQRIVRIAGAGSPMLPVCLEPVTGSFTFRANGSVSAVASVIDRATGDARTVVPVAAESLED